MILSDRRKAAINQPKPIPSNLRPMAKFRNSEVGLGNCPMPLAVLRVEEIKSLQYKKHASLNITGQLTFRFRRRQLFFPAVTTDEGV